MTVEEYIGDLEAPLREIAEKLRAIIRETDDKIFEQIKWNVPVYSLRRNICSIIAHKNHVNFQIFQGGSITDSEQLEGTGQNMRHLKFSMASQVKKTEVQRYLNQAIELERTNRA